MTILLSALSASMGSLIGGWSHEANDHSRGKGCALLGLFCSRAYQYSAVTGA